VHSHDKPEALKPQTIYEFEIEVWAVANVFKRGHRIRIDIANSDFPFFESNPVPSWNVVHAGQGNPSRIILLVPDRS